MRYPPDQKQKAKKAILEAGSREIRMNGINGIGVDGIAAAAGVTSGAFYSNFAGKEAMLEAVIDGYLGDFFVAPADAGLAERQAMLREWLTDYISPAHRDDAAAGCVMPSLSADVSRSSDMVRLAYRRKISNLVVQLAGELVCEDEERERRAWSILSIMVGAVTISRALPAGTAANRVLEAALDSAIELAGI
jgi:TetR/AcrR family transcriptional regulator, transcriptional repressor for nem operon